MVASEAGACALLLSVSAARTAMRVVKALIRLQSFIM